MNAHSASAAENEIPINYIRIASLIDAINAKLFIGKPVKVAIKDDLAEKELQRLLKQTSVVYIREDIVLGPSA